MNRRQSFRPSRELGRRLPRARGHGRGAELQVSRSGRRFARDRGGSYVTLIFECRAGRRLREHQVRVALARRQGPSVRIRPGGRFALARRGAGLQLRVLGRFVTPDYARLVYDATMPLPRGLRGRGPGRCRTGRSRVVLCRNGQPPFEGCRTHRARTLLRTESGRIIEQLRVPNPAGFAEFFPHVYACLFDSDRRVLLGRNWDDEEVEVPRLAGPFVAYASVGCGISGCQAIILIGDLRDGSVVRRVAPTTGRAEGPFAVTDLELRDDGALAWIVSRGSRTQPGFSARELWVSDGRGQRMLDGGPELELESLALSGSTLTWVNAGQTRSATLE